MKTFRNITIIAAALCSAVAVAAVPENIYPIGDATDARWTTSEAEPMHRDGNTFEIDCYLCKDKELKFLTEQNFECATFFAPQNGTVIGTDGFTGTMSYRQGGDDNKWKVQDNGYYKITLTLPDEPTAENGGTITVQKTEEPAVPNHVYIIGDAPNAGKDGWDTGMADKLEKNENVFTYYGPLVEGKTFKFITGRLFESRNYYASENDLEVGTENAFEGSVNYGPNDYKWKVTKTGMYRIELTINPDGTMENDGTLKVEYEAYPQVHIVGEAVGTKESKEAPAMENWTEINRYVWSGTLDNTTEGNENKLFKFCLAQRDWNKILYLIPASATEAGVTVIEPGEHDLQYSHEFGGQGVKDAFFGLPQNTKGDYTITVNPTTMKMTLDAGITTGVNTLAVEASEGVEEVYDLQGRKVAGLETAAPGIYVVRKGGVAKKVAVK